MHRAGGAEHKHILNAPAGSISPVTVVGAHKAQEQEGQKYLLTDVQSSANP